MTSYWCVNFEFDACLKYGIRRKLWLMQYQYQDDEGHLYQGGPRSGLTTFIWRRMKMIRAGDKLVAYLPGCRFFATGTAVAPRRKRTRHDRTSTIDEYVEAKDSHGVSEGYIYYSDAPAFYEDFSDDWRHPEDDDVRYAQRIDVDEWRTYVPNGIEQGGLVNHFGVSRIDTRKAAFPIKKRLFDRISSRLVRALLDRTRGSKH